MTYSHVRVDWGPTDLVGGVHDQRAGHDRDVLEYLLLNFAQRAHVCVVPCGKSGHKMLTMQIKLFEF